MKWELFLLIITGLRAKAELAEVGEYKWKWHDEVRYRIAMWLPL